MSRNPIYTSAQKVSRGAVSRIPPTHTSSQQANLNSSRIPHNSHTSLQPRTDSRALDQAIPTETATYIPLTTQHLPGIVGRGGLDETHFLGTVNPLTGGLLGGDANAGIKDEKEDIKERDEILGYENGCLRVRQIRFVSWYVAAVVVKFTPDPVYSYDIIKLYGFSDLIDPGSLSVYGEYVLKNYESSNKQLFSSFEVMNKNDTAYALRQVPKIPPTKIANLPKTLSTTKGNAPNVYDIKSYEIIMAISREFFIPIIARANCPRGETLTPSLVSVNRKKYLVGGTLTVNS